jgi:hypothetical protein
VAAALTIAAPDGARAADDTSSPAYREAKARFEEGLKRANAGEWEAARIAFQQAYAVMPRPAVILNLAISEQSTNRPLDALGHLKEYLRHDVKDSERQVAQQRIDQLNAVTGHIQVTAPSGAVVTVDDKTTGTAPLADVIDVTPGHHTVAAKGAAAAKTQDVDTAAGQTVNVDLSGAQPPSPLPSATAPASGASTEPIPTTDVPPPPSSPPARLITTIALGGAALVAGGLAFYFGQQSSSKADSANQLHSQNPSCGGAAPPAGCAQLKDDTQAAHNDYVASEVLWITGAVLAAGAIGTWVLWPRPQQTTGVTLQIVPSVATTGAGAMAVGRF